MIGSLPDEVPALRKSAEHVIKLLEKMIVSLPPVSATKTQKLDREKTVVNLYVAGHPIDESGEPADSEAEVPYSAFSTSTESSSTEATTPDLSRKEAQSKQDKTLKIRA